MSSKDPQKVREASKRFYDRNPDYYRERNRIQRQRHSDYIRSRREVPCFDCGIQYPWYVMEFDHREEKVAPVSRLKGHSWKKINEEIDRCDVVCANCHCVRTHMRRQESVSQLVED